MNSLFLTEKLLVGLLSSCSNGLPVFSLSFVTLKKGGSRHRFLDYLQSNVTLLGKIALCYLKVLVKSKLKGVVFLDFEDYLERQTIALEKLALVKKRRRGETRIYAFSYQGSKMIDLLKAVVASAVYF